MKYYYQEIAYPTDARVIDYLRVGITGVSDVAYRAEEVEEALLGKKPTKDAIKEAAELATEDGDMGEDLFASEEYREHLTKVYVKRALNEVLLTK